MKLHVRRKHLNFAGAALVAALLVLAETGLWARWFGESVVNNALVGQSESQVRSKYGEPRSEEPRYARLGIQPGYQLPAGAIKTLIFEPRGLLHLEGGTLWVWFRQQSSGEWICFESCWFADGVQF